MAGTDGDPRWALPPLVTLLVGLLLAGAAAAHAVIVSSTPKAGETVKGPDLNVRLVLNSRIDRARSSLRLRASGGTPRALTLEDDAEPNTLSAHVTGLAPGAYGLLWQTLSVDGHVTHGEIPFHVAAP
jgi:methionine-rich copper-binding protein CopC